MTELTTAWMLSCISGFFMGVAVAATYAASWQQFNPCGLLQALIAA